MQSVLFVLFESPHFFSVWASLWFHPSGHPSTHPSLAGCLDGIPEVGARAKWAHLAFSCEANVASGLDAFRLAKTLAGAKQNLRFTACGRIDIPTSVANSERTVASKYECIMVCKMGRSTGGQGPPRSP